MSVFRDDEGNERIEPSHRAMEARDAWLKRNPHYKDRMREQLTGHWPYTEAELDAAVERWRRTVEGISDDQWRARRVAARRAHSRAMRSRRIYALALAAALTGVVLAIVAVLIVASRA